MIDLLVTYRYWFIPERLWKVLWIVRQNLVQRLSFFILVFVVASGFLVFLYVAFCIFENSVFSLRTHNAHACLYNCTLSINAYNFHKSFNNITFFYNIWNAASLEILNLKITKNSFECGMFVRLNTYMFIQTAIYDCCLHFAMSLRQNIVIRLTDKAQS